MTEHEEYMREMREKNAKDCPYGNTPRCPVVARLRGELETLRELVQPAHDGICPKQP